MENIALGSFFSGWQRKLVALIAAVIVWIFVNHSIVASKTVSNVPVRISNLPADKTIRGLLPNGVLGKRITLTLSGTKDVIEDLEPGDLEVLIDASTFDSDEWIVQITKKNLISLNPSIDLAHHVRQIDHTEFIIKLSQLVTAKIPINIMRPIGNAPEGYRLLGAWPKILTQTLSGPQEEIEKLKKDGLALQLDLDDISQQDLDEVETVQDGKSHDEISFFIPNKWKQINIPFRNHILEHINDANAKNLRIEFLRRDFYPINTEIPVNIFYPTKTLDTLNPESYSLATNEIIKDRNSSYVFSPSLFVHDVSKLYLDIVKDNIEIVIIAAPKEEREMLHWNVEVLDPKEVEDTYVAYLIGDTINEDGQDVSLYKQRERILRKRFQEYGRRLRLFTKKNQKLRLESTLKDNKIHVTANSK